jgi:hypothetical protein
MKQLGYKLATETKEEAAEIVHVAQ